MGFFLFIILLLVIGGAIYFYNRLQIIEEEIRREIAAAESRAKAAKSTDEKVSAAPAADVKATAEPLAVVATAVQDDNQVVQAIGAQPGLRQTELYERCPGLPKRQIQAEVRNLVEQGQVRREREGSTYRLFLL